MPPPMQTALYLTGTDTDAGKTHTAVVLLHALRRAGQSAVGMKPLASGCLKTAEGWRNEDALRLQAASDPRPEYALVNPWALREPTAPEIAAALDGVSPELPPIEQAFARLAASADHVVVEGVGGWMAPLTTTLMQVDLVRALDLPVVLVVGLRLGCINHALLTAAALRNDRVRAVGWIGTAVDPGMPHRAATFDILCHRLDLPCLGLLPHGDPAETCLAIDIDRLLAR